MKSFQVNINTTELKKTIEKAVTQERERIISIIQSGKYCHYVEHSQGQCECSEFVEDLRNPALSASEDEIIAAFRGFYEDDDLCERCAARLEASEVRICNWCRSEIVKPLPVAKELKAEQN